MKTILQIQTCKPRFSDVALGYVGWLLTAEAYPWTRSHIASPSTAGDERTYLGLSPLLEGLWATDSISAFHLSSEPCLRTLFSTTTFKVTGGGYEVWCSHASPNDTRRWLQVNSPKSWGTSNFPSREQCTPHSGKRMQGHGLVGKSVCSNTSIVTYGETAARGRNDQNLYLIFILCHNSSVPQNITTLCRRSGIFSISG